MTPQDDTRGWFNFTDYERNALRLLRAGLSAEWRIGDQVALLTEVRSENGRAVKPYALYVRVRPLRRVPLDIQAGRIPPVFGAYARRDYAAGNPLIGYPLAYQYLTSIRPDAIPADASDLLRMRARGWRPGYPIGSLAVATGLPLVSAMRWDTGVEASVGSARVTASAALTNGTVSDPRTRDNNTGKQLSARLQWRPVPSLIIGASAARGSYLAGAVTSLERVALAGGGSMQEAFGVDAEVARDHWLVRGEAVLNQWRMPTLSGTLRASSVFGEARYKIRPGAYVAGRIDHLGFSRLQAGGQYLPWDAPVTRVETGVGYYLRHNWLAKVAYQQNWRDAGFVRRSGFLAAQLQGWL